MPLIERGLDHGAWMPLHFLYPKASVPIIQLSINKSLSMDLHVKIGETLQCLRDEGIMIVGSGNLTHNLRLVDFYNIEAKSVEWAKNVDTFIENAFTCKNIQSLIDSEKQCPDFKTAHPSPDHYLPLLYIEGTCTKEDTIQTINPFFQNASLSMKGFLLS